MENKKHGTFIISLLAALSIGLLFAIYYTPTWWVALTAPNYPETAFPDGVRINFHMNGVFNGCKKVEKEEIEESEALDCVHEMDTINHYVGMYPIAAGGPVERAFSPFLVTMLGLMIIAFAIEKNHLRIIFLSAGLIANAIWMGLTIYSDSGLSYHNVGYVSALVNHLDQDVKDKDSGDSGESSIVAALRRSLEESGVEIKKPEYQNETKELSEKERLINSLQDTYKRDREYGRVDEDWSANVAQVMGWHYGKVLGRYFNNQEEIAPMVSNLKIATHVVFVGLLGAMLLLIYGARKGSGLLYWLLILVPMALPVFFVIDYAAWLWWYGHTLNDMGAFSVKPFMPTVFGVGKVAQFSTYSYPSIGFGLMFLNSIILAAIALIRRKHA